MICDILEFLLNYCANSGLNLKKWGEHDAELFLAPS